MARQDDFWSLFLCRAPEPLAALRLGLSLQPDISISSVFCC